MKHLMKLSLLTITLFFMGFATITYAQDDGTNPVIHGTAFVDENGDGYNDNAPDHDNDGIPNGHDPDYTSLNPEAGKRYGGFVDEDGDGINDRMQDADGDGTPNCLDEDWVRPQDGTGKRLGQKAQQKMERMIKGFGQRNGLHGAGNSSEGSVGKQDSNCDGIGPKGQQANRGNK